MQTSILLSSVDSICAFSLSAPASVPEPAKADILPFAPENPVAVNVALMSAIPDAQTEYEIARQRAARAYAAYAECATHFAREHCWPVFVKAIAQAEALRLKLVRAGKL